MDYYIGIDIGTTSTKAVAFDIYGSMMAKYSIGYELYHPQPDWSELKPTEIFDAVVGCLHQIAMALPNDNPVLISFDSLMHSVIAVGGNNTLLTDCIIWADNRAAEIAEHLNKSEHGETIYQLTGVPVHAMAPLSKILWLKENQPGIFKHTNKFIGIKEFIFHQLFEEYVVDTGIASTTGLLNIHTLKWEKTILDLIGINENQLSTLVSPTYKLFKNNDVLKLASFKNTAFIIGGSDGAFANLGSGATNADSLAITIGTSGAVRMLSQQVYIDNQRRTFCYFVNGNDYIIGGASNNGAVAIQWLKENILETETGIEELLTAAKTIEPGCNGLLFLPYLLGERAPLWNAKAKAVFFGLDITHTKAHLLRAAMEGILYNLYAIGEVLFQFNKPKIIYANGGFTKNNLWVQMLADLFNMPIIVPDAEESSALGAVMVGLKALNIPSQIKQTMGKNYWPNFEKHQIYMSSFKRFQRINKLVESEFE